MAADGPFSGRVAVVTGAATGIGRACAHALAERGATVVPVGLPHPHRDEELPGYLPADLTDALAVAGIAARVADRHGRVDILINNAGILHRGSIEETTPHEWDLVLASNVKSAYLVSRALLPLMRPHGGSITHIASVHAWATAARHAAYAASKGALVALARAMAIDAVADRIRVNALLVGKVATAMSIPPGLTEADLAAMRDPTRLARLADPSEVAAAVCLLASDEASFITGAAVAVDGGLLARLDL